jgi:hypothetical protein|tara:strand:+ start:2934 stop:4118 length:1185 start_codon:yes stop_codon:yes gene_type:complete
MSRKIHNFSSDILVDETFNEFGYYPDKYGPSSAKFIIAQCRYCGSPARIRKCFYKKADNSACHNECRLEEQRQQRSPFSSKETREKAKKTMQDRYGVDYASQNKIIAKKISNKKRGISHVDKQDFSLSLISLGYNVNVPRDFHFIIDNLAIDFNLNINSSEYHLPYREALMKHRQKLDIARKQNLRLFHIFENHWHNRKPQILNFIKSILGKNHVKIHGRKCVITNDNAKDFINTNHIQGYGKGTIRYFNLVHKEEIVASLTASGHHRQNVEGNPIILNRLCFKDDYNVQGGSSKLFKAFKEWSQTEGYDRILSWSDSCWTEGRVYEVLGFDLTQEYGPDYFYWDTNSDCYVSKQSQRKRNTNCPADMTEREWAMQRGLYRIWDCGKKKWEFKL